MKKILVSIVGLATAVGALGLNLLPASAAVNVTVTPASLVTSPLILPSGSPQIAVFSFSLANTATETVSSIMVEVDKANGSTTVSSSHLASVSLYKDDGGNVFNPVAGNLVGSQATVNIGSITSITPATTTSASGKFYVSLATSGSWSAAAPVDSISVTLPANAITASANSPTISPLTTASISAALINTPSCSNGITNGATYQMLGKGGGKFTAVNCALQPVSKGDKDNDGNEDDNGSGFIMPPMPPMPTIKPLKQLKFNFGKIFHSIKKGGK